MKHFLSVIMLVTALLPLCAADVYTIYPTPHHQLATGGNATFSPSVTIVADGTVDDVTVVRAREVLNEHGIAATTSHTPAKNGANLVLGTLQAGGEALKLASTLKLDMGVFSLDKFDRHILSLSANNDGVAQVVILGENTDAVFCGLASLEQMLDTGIAHLPCVTITDYADVKNRGIIEGYYGVPYSAEVTKDIFHFMARYKMNTYMYGAKSDPYHSRYWGEPYPATITDEERRIGYLSQDMMRDIAATATATKVNFIWAIHPGTAFADPQNTGVIDQIMGKFEGMYSLGVRQFGVFVDDVGVPNDTAVLNLCARNISTLQNRIDSRWNTPSASPADTVKPLHYVPQLYAFSWTTRDVARQFFESLKTTPDKLNIYITGRNVWSVPNNEDLDIVRSWLGREVSWWWNYPCNDQDPTKLFVMDTYTNFRDETHILNLSTLEPELKGTNTVIINPMQQGELSKIALFGVADYTWNNSAFNNNRSWEAAVQAVGGDEYAAALRKAAPYLRHYDNDGLEYLIKRYKQSVERRRPNADALLEELRGVRDACAKLRTLETSPDNSLRLLYDDMRPWLLKLHDMTTEAVALLEGEFATPVDFDGNPDYKFNILGGMGESIALEVCTAEPAAKCLPEFIMWLREHIGKQ